jgi:hypothetical protein
MPLLSRRIEQEGCRIGKDIDLDLGTPPRMVRKFQDDHPS